MKSHGLRKLPLEVKALVNDGIYSLYAVVGLPGVAFVLMTNASEFYALSADGEVLPETPIKQLKGLRLVEAVHFQDIRREASLKLNCV